MTIDQKQGNLQEALVAAATHSLFGNSKNETLNDFSLPSSKNENYRFLPISRQLEKNFTSEQLISAAPSSIHPTITSWLGHEAVVVSFQNGRLAQISNQPPQEEILIVSLQEALEKHPEKVNPILGKLALSDPFTALNDAASREGLFIWVSHGNVIQHPIHIIHSQEAITTGSSHTRLVVSLSQQSEITLLEEFQSTGSSPFFQTQVTEMECQSESKLNYVRIQNDSGRAYQVANTVIHQHDKSIVNACTITMDGEVIRNNFSIMVDGEFCESNFNGLYLLNKKTIADNHTIVDHQKPNSQSNELYKGIMNDQSRGIFNGKIFVRPHAQKTNAFQSNRNILLTDTATINTKPQLEIWADDVKCSHGCTSGQLDEEALFYLQSRGISKKAAQGMLLYAFASEVIKGVSHAGIQTHLDQLIQERLSHTL
jgi:Fe-S cluster assembly protein SufD